MAEEAPKTETIHIELPPETVAFYKAIHEAVNDPRLKTQDLLLQLDLEITEINDQGYPTADMTEILDDLWAHLKEQGWTLPISDEQLKEMRDRQNF